MPLRVFTKSKLVDVITLSLQEKMPTVTGEKRHHNLIGDDQKGFRHQKLNVTKGSVTKSKVMVSDHHQFQRKCNQKQSDGQ